MENCHVAAETLLPSEHFDGSRRYDDEALAFVNAQDPLTEMIRITADAFRVDPAAPATPCSICFNPLPVGDMDVMRTACEHMFCADCMVTWFAINPA